MSLTYSINTGQLSEATRMSDINSAISNLPDNTQKLISPRDVRDAILTAWASSPIKETIGGAGIEYIGIDSGNPYNRDLKSKIFLGKRSYTGQDIMSNQLLSSDTDIFFYNTKLDTDINQDTKISILAGTNSILHQNAPFLQSSVNSTGSALDLGIINPLGSINISSLTGRVSINGIQFPTILESSMSASNGRILKYYGNYPNGILRWDDPTVTLSSFGATGTPTYIYGTVSVNGYNGNSLEFINNNIVSGTVGGISIGDSFPSGSFNGSNWPITEVIRKLLYPYIPPAISFEIITNTQVLETYTNNIVTFSYSIGRYSEPIYEYEFVDSSMNIIAGQGGLSYMGAPGTYYNSTFTHSISSVIGGTPSITNFHMRVKDNNNLLTFSYSATSSVTFVDPIYYCYTTYNLSFSGSPAVVSNNTGNMIDTYCSKFIKRLDNTNQIELDYNGVGYLYILLPISEFPRISKIKDPNGFVIYDSNSISTYSFTYSQVITPNIPSKPSNITSYIVYKTTNITSYSGVGKFKFEF